MITHIIVCSIISLLFLSFNVYTFIALNNIKKKSKKEITDEEYNKLKIDTNNLISKIQQDMDFIDSATTQIEQIKGRGYKWEQ